MGDRRAHLGLAVRALRRLDPGLEVSNLYETAPVGGPDQGSYLNCVVRLETALTPAQLLETAMQIEQDAGRIRSVKNGPRTLDVDLLLLDELRISTPELEVPHPRMAERAFVLAPLEDLDPAKVPAGWRESLGGTGEVERAVRRVANLEAS